jgi:hypothetical protein
MMLPAESRRRAWERGASLELGVVVDALLNKEQKNESTELTWVHDAGET